MKPYIGDGTWGEVQQLTPYVGYSYAMVATRGAPVFYSAKFIHDRVLHFVAVGEVHGDIDAWPHWRTVATEALPEALR